MDHLGGHWFDARRGQVILLLTYKKLFNDFTYPIPNKVEKSTVVSFYILVFNLKSSRLPSILLNFTQTSWFLALNKLSRHFGFRNKPVRKLILSLIFHCVVTCNRSTPFKITMWYQIIFNEYIQDLDKVKALLRKRPSCDEIRCFGVCNSCTCAI